MSKVRLKKESLNNLSSLSCVENYILGFLKEENINISMLFYDSYVSFNQIYNDFHEENIQYAYYNSIPRVQLTANNINILNLSHSDNISIKDIDFYDGSLLMGVKPEYFIKRYNTNLWREDHYFYIEKLTSETYYFVNDNPREEGYLSKNEIEALFNGQIIRFEILGNITDRSKLELLIKLYKKLKNRFLDQSVNFTKISNLQTRDFYGVLRISRKRIEEFLSNYFDTDFMQDYLILINKYYATIEYERLRKKLDLETLLARLKETEKYDKIIIELIIEKVGNYIMNNFNEKALKVVESFTIVRNIKETDELLSIGIDSLKMVELIIALEDEFGIQFNDSELDPSQISIVDDIYKLVQQKL